MTFLIRPFPLLWPVLLLVAVLVVSSCKAKNATEQLEAASLLPLTFRQTPDRFEIGYYFPKPPQPRSKFNLIPKVSRKRRRRCIRSARRFARKYGFFSKGQHACCLFGRKSGFCEKIKIFERGRVCNDAPYITTERGILEAPPNNRSQWTTGMVDGRCCLNEIENRTRGEPWFRMDCLDDQTDRKDLCSAECVKKDSRCEEGGTRVCECNYNKVWIYEPMRRVSRHLDARLTIFSNSCFTRDANTAGVNGLQTCCGVGMLRNLCAYWRRLCRPVPGIA